MDLLLVVGIILIIGFVGSKVSNRLKFPGVIGYIAAGIIIGPSVLGILSHGFLEQTRVINDFALGLIAFMIGSELRWDMIKKTGKSIIIIMITEAMVTFILVAVGVYLLSQNIALSLILGSLGVATAPAGTYVVLREYKAKGPLTNVILAVVGLDDAMALMIYSFAIAIAKVSFNTERCISIGNVCLEPFVEIIGAIALGALLGMIVVALLKKRHDRNEILIISIASVFICSGISNMIHLSLILSNLVLGVVIINISSLTGSRISNAVQNLTQLIFLFFFVLAGAHLNVRMLPAMGLIGLGYILFRILGKLCGSRLGAVLGKAEYKVKKYLGYGLLTQAGVAIGLAMLVGRDFGVNSSLAITVIAVITATTVVFEIIGAFGVKYSIMKSGEIGQAERTE